jgi:hypothetical protein
MGWKDRLLVKAYGAIKGVKPLSKTGGKSVEDWKTIARKAKLKAAVFDIKQSLSKTGKNISEVTKTLKKQKKILDD